MRLRDQLAALGLSLAEAARQMGHENSLGLRDVCLGRKRASAELMVQLGRLGVDVTYILTGASLKPDSLAQVTEVLRITAQQEPQGGPLTDKAIAAIHDIGGLAVAEPRAAYAPISPRERALLDNYRAADEAGKKALETTGAALAQPAARQEKHG